MTARKTRVKVKAGGRGPSVWALAVVSSEQQSETLAHQRQWAQDVATSHGWHLSRVIEGVASGKAGPRRLVRDLLADLQAVDGDGRPKKLLMIRADRLGRGSVIESQIVLRDLLRLGVGIFTRDQGNLKLDSAMDELISAATLAVARHENEVRSDKAKAVRQRKAKAGEPMGQIPYGLKRDGKRNVPDRERAPIVREAFKLRLQGKGYNVIGRQLSAIAPPHVFMNAKSQTVHWTPTRVRMLLGQRAYIGTIVDEATFARAQKVAGLEPTCGSAISVERVSVAYGRFGSLPLWARSQGNSVRGRAVALSVLRVQRALESWRECCGSMQRREARRTILVCCCLERLRASPKLVEQYSRRAASPVSPRMLERSIKEVKAKLAEVGRRRDVAWELHVSGKVRAEDVQERLDALAEQRDNFRGQMATAQEQLAISKAASTRGRDVEALFRRASQIFLKAKVEEQNQIARAVSLELGGLVVDPSGKIHPAK